MSRGCKTPNVARISSTVLVREINRAKRFTRMSWNFWKKHKPVPTEAPAATDFLLSERAKNAALNDHLLSDQAKIRATNEHLLVEQRNIRTTNAHLLKDQQFIKGTVELHERERSWYERDLKRLEKKYTQILSIVPEPKQSPLPGGILSRPDMEAITELAKAVPAGGVIVDVGSLLGLSASLWCKHSKAARIVCIDPWVYDPWMKDFCEKHGPVSKEVFLANVPDPRIETIVGYSPQCGEGWKDPIDLYWEDGEHSDPGCSNSILFWSSHVRPDGIACGHDYHWPDVRRQADALAERWKSTVQVKGAVWSVKRAS